MKQNFLRRPFSSFLVIMLLVSNFFVLYLSYVINFAYTSSSFIEVLKTSLNFNFAKLTLSDYLMLLLNSTLLVLFCTVASFVIGFILSGNEKIAKLLAFLAVIPELFLAVVLRIIFKEAIIYNRGNVIKGLIISLPIIIRTSSVMYRYFRIARERYYSTYFPYILQTRRVGFIKRVLYLFRSTFLDSASNLSFEFAFLVSYVAIMERLFDFEGLSRHFFNNMIYGDSYELIRLTFFILLMLLLFQSHIIIAIRLSDKR